MALSWVYRAHSEIGLVRKNNQDSGFVGRHLVMVADGMGGAAAGDLASAVAVDSIRHVDERVQPTGDGPDDHAGDQGGDQGGGRNLHLLSVAIGEANARLAELISADFSLEGMGTTVTAAVLADDELSLAHIGDSRAYLYRDGRLERLTHDHSWVQSLIDDGKISETEAAVHPHRSLLLRVLNGQNPNEPDLTRVALSAGDRLLFCSDGLCGFVEDSQIATELALADLDQAMDHLVGAAHRAGGLDNITIVIVELDEAGPAGEPGASQPSSEAPLVFGAADELDIPSTDTMIRDRLLEPEEFEDEDEALVDTDALPDEDRYVPQPPAKRRLARPLISLLVVLLVVAAGAGAGFAWSRTQYYVGDQAGQVAIYQGLSARPLGVPLSRVYEVQPLRTDALPPLYQQMVLTGIDATDLPGARETVVQLRRAAEACARQQHRPKPTSSSSPTTGRSSATPTGPTSAPAGSAGPSTSAHPTSAHPTSEGSLTSEGVTSPSASPSGALPPTGQSC